MPNQGYSNESQGEGKRSDERGRERRGRRGERENNREWEDSHDK